METNELSPQELSTIRLALMDRIHELRGLAADMAIVARGLGECYTVKADEAQALLDKLYRMED